MELLLAFNRLPSRLTARVSHVAREYEAVVLYMAVDRPTLSYTRYGLSHSFSMCISMIYGETLVHTVSVCVHTCVYMCMCSMHALQPLLTYGTGVTIRELRTLTRYTVKMLPFNNFIHSFIHNGATVLLSSIRHVLL